MRLSFSVLLIASAFATVWAQAGLPAKPPTPTSAASAGAAEGFSARLADLAGLRPLGVVSAQRDADGIWRLRGRAALRDGVAAGWPAPLYAEAQAICDADLRRPACWRLLRLEVNGLPLNPGPGPDPVFGTASDAAMPGLALPPSKEDGPGAHPMGSSRAAAGFAPASRLSAPPEAERGAARSRG